MNQQLGLDMTIPANQTYEIVFDGGALGNPGKGYGSFHIMGPEGPLAHERLEYGDNVTNNQAEYRTLIAALKYLKARLGDKAPHSRVIIRGDSQLVINQVNGAWKVKNADLMPFRQEVVTLLRQFGDVDLAWHRRDKSVRLLGH